LIDPLAKNMDSHQVGLVSPI